MAGKSWGSIVGVIDDVKYSGPGRRADPEAYVPLAFWPTGYVAVLMRTEGDPDALIPAARAAVRGVDADLPIQDVRTLDEVVSRSVALPQFRLILIALFALLAVVLATIGLYGVLAQSVAQRRQEIGIRMALGAGRSSIATMVLREGLAISAVGLVAGAGVSIWVSRLLASFLFGVTATNVPTYVLVAVALAVVTALVTLGPVLRAVRSDPAAVLRAE
jgi:ABC-type antimicrobial peptide transport system permease subunit